MAVQWSSIFQYWVRGDAWSHPQWPQEWLLAAWNTLQAPTGWFESCMIIQSPCCKPERSKIVIEMTERAKCYFIFWPIEQLNIIHQTKSNGLRLQFKSIYFLVGFDAPDAQGWVQRHGHYKRTIVVAGQPTHLFRMTNKIMETRMARIQHHHYHRQNPPTNPPFPSRHPSTIRRSCSWCVIIDTFFDLQLESVKRSKASPELKLNVWMKWLR